LDLPTLEKQLKLILLAFQYGRLGAVELTEEKDLKQYVPSFLNTFLNTLGEHVFYLYNTIFLT
jgi:hypothetical protein